MTQPLSRFRGFTLIEVIVAFATASVLLAILVPALQSARESSRRSLCHQRMMQLGIALQNYHSAHEQFPIASGLGVPGQFSYDPGPHRTGSMQIRLLPYLDQTALYNRLDFSTDVVVQFESDPNLRTQIIPSFVCPSDNQNGLVVWHGVGRAQCNFAPSLGSQIAASNRGSCTRYPGNAFGTGKGLYGDFPDPRLVSGVFSRSVWSARLGDITDGISNTIAMGEIRPQCHDHATTMGWYPAQTWFITTSVPMNFNTCPDLGGNASDIPADCHSWNNWTTSAGFKSRHPGGVHFLLCDGSVRFLSEKLDLALFERLGDRRDGMDLGEF